MSPITPLDFDELFAAMRPKVLGFLHRFVDAGEAEDLTQEVFLKVHQGLPGFRRENKVSTWVFQIATHLALDRVRSAAFRQANLARPMAEAEASTSQEGHARTPVQEEMCDCIRNLVATLPLAYRTIINLNELQELPITEIAAILDLSPSAAKIRLHRARKLLKDRLEHGCRIILDARGEVQCDQKLPVSI